MASEAHRNPTWTRDELILALDFYVQYGGNPPAKDSAAIKSLSELLNTLGSAAIKASDKFRNVNGVYMKIMNFRRFDPIYAAKGAVGLSRGGKGDEEVWNDFLNRPNELKKTAAAIQANISLNPKSVSIKYDEIEIAEAEEGRILTRIHTQRERNREIVKKKKLDAMRQKGVLACEVCSFDFERMYGERGIGFAEVHHTKPLHTLVPGSMTKLEDLAILCANCHRMVHAKRPWLELTELKSRLRSS